jgi:hypothetical protein
MHNRSSDVQLTSSLLGMNVRWTIARAVLAIAACQITYITRYTALCVTQVLRIEVNSNGLPTGVVEEVYSNNGEELTGSTIAVRYRGGLLIGTAIDGALYCELGSCAN